MAEDSRSTILSYWLITFAAAVLYYFFQNPLTLGFLSAAALLALFSLFFFRDPKRNIPVQKGIMVSPADGKILFVNENAEYPEVGGTCTHMAVFLNLHDVHVNRIPYEGRIRSVDYLPGKFLRAFVPEATDLNEQYFVVMDTDTGTMMLRQIAGIIARRLVCRLHPGQDVAMGEKFGLMKFSSRIDLYFSSKFRVLVEAGQRVRGGETILARLTESNL